MSILFEDRGAYRIAEEKARKVVSELLPEVVAAERKIKYDSEAGKFIFAFFDREIFVTYPEGAVLMSGGKRVSGAVAVVALHYLMYSGEPVEGHGWLPYRDMPGARHFSTAFESMAESRLSAYFGNKPERFVRSAVALGGVGEDVGDASFVVPALPRVPLLIAMWFATDEFPAAAKIYYKPNASYYLHSEDLAVIGVLAVDRLIEIDGEIGGGFPSTE